MATLSFSITSTPVTGTRSFTLTDADVSRWIAAYRPAAVQAAKGASQTDAQVLAYWAREVVRQSRQQTRDVETVPPADITITEN